MDNYLADLQEAVSKINPIDVQRVANLFIDVLAGGGSLFTIGNGGSAANAMHFVCDLREHHAYCFCDNPLLLSALGNDQGFEYVFEQQVRSHAHPSDALVAISGSGNSPNILMAVEQAKRKGCTTVGLCGFDGGKLKTAVDHCLHISVDDMQIVEDVHCVVLHMIAKSVCGSLP
jgi:D-sedoheptulose 7-phosphate isomerase